MKEISDRSRFDENYDNENIVDIVRKMSKESRMEFIRGILTNPDGSRARFDMSGYENCAGEVTINNTAIVNRFAFLGIHDYHRYLVLDFYKGGATLYADNTELFEDGGYGTRELIYKIFQHTILSDKHARRRT